MTIPPIVNFTLKQESFWYTINEEKDYNLFVNDDSSVPDQKSYDLLIKAESEMTRLFQV